MFGLIQGAMRTVRMAEYYLPSIKKLSDKLMNAYTNTITPETWTEKVADVDTSDMSYAEKVEARQLAQQYADLATGQCDNLAQAIQEDPASWGRYLQEKGVDSEKLTEIETKVQEEGQIPPLELVKLTMDGTPIDDAKEAAKEAVNDIVSGKPVEGASTEASAAGGGPDRGQQAEAALGAIVQNIGTMAGANTDYQME